MTATDVRQEYRLSTDVYGRNVGGLVDLVASAGNLPKSYVIDRVLVEQAEDLPEKLTGSRLLGNFVARVTLICRPIAQIVISADQSDLQESLSNLSDRMAEVGRTAGTIDDRAESSGGVIPLVRSDLDSLIAENDRAREEAEKARRAEAEDQLRRRAASIEVQAGRIAERIRRIDRESYPYVWPTNRNALCDAVGEAVRQARLIIPEPVGRDIPKYREALFQAAVLITNELATVSERENAPHQGVPFS